MLGHDHWGRASGRKILDSIERVGCAIERALQAQTRQRPIDHGQVGRILQIVRTIVCVAWIAQLGADGSAGGIKESSPYFAAVG